MMLLAFAYVWVGPPAAPSGEVGSMELRFAFFFSAVSTECKNSER